MTAFSYKQRAADIYVLCEEIIQSLEDQQNENINKFVDEYKAFLLEHRKQSQLSIAFIGQYNAGKSSTIAALTNAKFVDKVYKNIDGEEKLVEVFQVDGNSLFVGAQIMTDETREYNWKDVNIIDTPGIYSGRTDHDQKTLDQISKSDLIVYVISNELFNPQGAEFFRKLVNEMHRSSQILLVINKMSREPGKPEILKKSILEVIEPYHSSDFFTTFIDSKDYLKAQREEDDEERSYLIEDSNFVAFQESLMKLIEKNQLNARLTTPLHRGIEILEKSLNIVSTDNKLSLGVLEVLRRKALLIKATETRFRNAVRSELNKVEHQVIMAGEKIAGKVDGQHSEEEVNASVKEAENHIEGYTKSTLDQIQLHLSKEIERLEGELENLQNSSLVKSVAASLQAQLAEKKTLNNSDIAGKEKIPAILTKGPEYLGKLGNLAAKVSKDQVYDFVKFFGGKFKPWGAAKLTKLINKIGPALSILGVVLDVFFSAKEEVDEAKFEQALRESRAEIREEFRNVAREIVSEYELIIDKEIVIFFIEELKSIEKQQDEIRGIEHTKEKNVSLINNLLNTAKAELRNIVEV
ncbi:GTPase [Guptibacillus hwajinpoensis]|uniref:GTPase n=1 Tax=Guptibacillus hwajinpoensis TaxID=208199 RepID=UPI00384DDD79